MKVIAIIQARMGSTRLPGKVMMKVSGSTVLEHVITRVAQSKSIDEIIIATTTKLDDDIIVEESKRLGIKYYRGSEEDVLSRYYYAAKENNADVVIRITSDCPLIDSEIIDRMMYKFKELYDDDKVDYLSNTIERTFPRGLDVEIFLFEILEQTFYNAEKAYEREHVTPYIYESSDKFKVIGYKSDINYSHHRWTLDTPEDFELINKIYVKLYNENKLIAFDDIINYFKLHPEYLQINSKIDQKKLRD